MDQPGQQGAAPTEAAIVVAARDVTKVYDPTGQPVTALDGVNLEVPAGCFFAIMGASGSGKSTLLHVIGGLTPPTAGTLLVDGQNLAAMSDRASLIGMRLNFSTSTFRTAGVIKAGNVGPRRMLRMPR